jgi:hypothetical protein
VSPVVEADTGVVVILVATKIIASVKIVAAIMGWMYVVRAFFYYYYHYYFLASSFCAHSRMRTSDKRLPPLDR